MSTNTPSTASHLAQSLPSLLSGALFGSALTLSTIYNPSLILSQMRLTNFHMASIFLTASLLSTVFIYLANSTNYATLSPRKPSSLAFISQNSSSSFLNRYSANILGGLLQGIGMALSGACPGTGLVQLALSMPSGRYVALGCLLGGVVFVKAAPYLTSSTASKTAVPPTLSSTTCLSQNQSTILYAIFLLLAISSTTHLSHHSSSSTSSTTSTLSPLAGGTLIGLSQLLSILLTRKTLGVSSAYEDLGKLFWSLAPSTTATTTTKPNSSSPPPTSSYTSIIFATGVMLGARLVAHFTPLPSVLGSDGTRPTAALLGGFASIMGARMAGGCTSGHGISGMSTLSISSFVTVACMFGGGIAWALATQ